MFLYDIARRANRYRKMRRKELDGRFLSPVRRIERTAALKEGRFVAMTFDDGPDALPPEPAVIYGHPVKSGQDKPGLTEELLYILDKYNAKGTFDVIGTTGSNYPDHVGKADSFTFGGVRYDHYPYFGQDGLGGVKNQPGLAKKIAAGGHELANHGYRHILFGPMKLIYGGRAYFKNLRETVDDLTMLHELVLKETGSAMRLSRPPHYVDRIPDGYTSYDAYQYMDYNYLAASFDAGGYKPSCGDYAKDVRDMVEPLEAALFKDEDVLNGQIIFQKDGSNMSRQTPVADALVSHLRLLTDAGYKVVTVSEMLKLSPFEDIGDSDPVFEWVRKLAAYGYTIGYRNNTFQPDRAVTKQELAIMSTPPGTFGKLFRELAGLKPAGMPFPYCIDKSIILSHGEIYTATRFPIDWFESNTPVTAADFDRFLSSMAEGRDVNWSPDEFADMGKPLQKPGFLRRRDVIKALAGVLMF